MKDSKLISSVFLLIWIFTTQSSAQRTLSLQQCVDIAFERSLNLQNADLNMEMAAVNTTQARHARNPNLSASTSYGYNFGRTIDPTTNAFRTQTTSYQTLGLNAGMNLYQGGVLNNSIKQAELSGLGAVRRKEALMDNIGLQVTQNYLNALLAKEAAALANYQIELTDNQLSRIDKLIRAGSVPANDRLELEAQSVRDQQQVIAAENNYQLALLNLKNLLLFDADENVALEEIDVDRVPVDASVLELSLQEVYAKALGYQPSIKADSIDMKVAELGKKINEGRLLPTLSIGGSLTTNFSSLGRRITGQEQVFNNIPIIINGMTVDVGFPGTDLQFEDNPYFNQLDENLGYGVGATLRMPIYNNNIARGNIERSDINIKQVHIQNEINKQTLKTTINSAMAQALAAQQSYLAAEKSVEAQKTTLANLEKKLQAGSANNFDFISAKNNLSISENTLIQSKYDYIFKLKVIDYYLGKPLKL